MHAVSAADLTTTRLSPAIESVAVVGPAGLVVRIIREALSSEAIALGEKCEDPAGLSDDAENAVAIVVVAGAGPRDWRSMVRETARRFPSVPVVVIAQQTRHGAHQALEAGAAGFVLESQVKTSLGVAIRAVRTGLIVAPRDRRRPAVRVPLTHRERETLALLVMGLTNRQIAARLFLAESTVKTHLTSIFAKLGVASRSEAVARALDPDERLGLGVLGLVPEAAVGPLEHRTP